jgi:ABC-type uncharacterized transport system involved in gliding motility auxiliary subunit
MTTERQKRLSYLTLVALAVAFIAAIIASNSLLRGVRLDLTEGRLYTLAPGTKSFLEGIEDPINLYFFFSDQVTADNNNLQGLRQYVVRVREMLEEFEAAAGGRLNLVVIDPLPFSEDEDRAAQFGLTDIALGALGDSVYFGLAATNLVGDEAIIEIFDPSKEGSLEYDLARLIFSLASPDKNVVGLISGLPLSGGFDPQAQRPIPPWVISQQARQLFDVRSLSTSFTTIEDDIDLLWIVHPPQLSESTLYAIDQFVLGGGRLLVFVDPLAEIAAVGSDPSGLGATSSSTLEPLLGAWGLEFNPGEVVADDQYGLSVDTGTGPRPLRHIGLIGLDDEAMNQEDLVTAGIASVNVGTAGRLRLAEGASIRLTPLLTSSPEAALFDSARFQFLADPEDLLDDFAPTGERYVIAARLEGSLRSAYPDGPPESEDDGAGASHRQSTDNANVIVVADVDVLSDRLWVQMRRSLFGQQVATAFAGNGDLVNNAMANLSGSPELIGLRSRATFSRPFDTVEALRRDADARFRETEQRLQSELGETERRLGELQSAREDTSSLLMSPEQQAEIQRFQDEQLRIRRELRAVRRELDSNIERLGTVLKLTNILSVPFALSLFGLIMLLIRRNRRKAIQ